jgi:hypothetical protein
MTKKTKRNASLAAVALAMIGIAPFVGSSCSSFYAVDAKTGLLRPATTQEAVQTVTAIGDAAGGVVAALGGAAYLPWIDLGVRVIALLTAWLLEPPRRKTATVAATP